MRSMRKYTITVEFWTNPDLHRAFEDILREKLDEMGAFASLASSEDTITVKARGLNGMHGWDLLDDNESGTPDYEE